MSICRICLCSKPRKDIAEIYTLENGERQAYKDIIMFCLGIQIKEDSVLSTKLCVKCCRKIVQFYHFKVLALSNDKQMRSSELKNGVFWFKENVKIEKESENNNTNLDECLIPQIKDESEIFDFDIRADDDDNTVEINYELKLEDHSDDEFLSVIKNLKKESVGEVKEDDTENMAPIQKKRKKTKVKIPKDLISKKKKNKGVYEGVCEHCGKVFKDLRQHVRVQHLQNKRKVNCEHCDKVFSNTVLKRRHVQRTHFAVKQKCHLCGRSVADLKMHIKCIHEKDSLRFKCVHCDFKFLSQGRLNAHMSVHTKDRPFKCDICNSSFRQKIGLDNHRRQIHYKEKSHLCQFCSKSFFKKHHLTIHLRSHTNEKPYPCPECGKFYQTTTSLRNHRLIHTANKRINCTLCDASFISKNYLSNHMLSHTKEKRYPCKYCHVKFHRSDHRKRHEYTAHLKFMGEVEHVPPSYTPKKRSTNAVTPRAKLFEDDSTASSVIALDAVDCETNSVVAVSKSLA